MPSSTPFVDRETGAVDTGQIVAEARPIATLVALFVAVALVPLALVFLLGGTSTFGVVLTVLAQFVLAVGAAVVLLYVVTRAIQLADE